MKSGLWLNGWGTLSTPVGLRRLLAAARISRFAHATEPEANKPRLQFPSKSAGVRVLLQHRHRAMNPASAVALPVSLGGAPCGRRLRVQQPANSDSSGGGRSWGGAALAGPAGGVAGHATASPPAAPACAPEVARLGWAGCPQRGLRSPRHGAAWAVPSWQLRSPRLPAGAAVAGSAGPRRYYADAGRRTSFLPRPTPDLWHSSWPC